MSYSSTYPPKYPYTRGLQTQNSSKFYLRPACGFYCAAQVCFNLTLSEDASTLATKEQRRLETSRRAGSRRTTEWWGWKGKTQVCAATGHSPHCHSHIVLLFYSGLGKVVTTPLLVFNPQFGKTKFSTFYEGTKYTFWWLPKICIL